MFSRKILSIIEKFELLIVFTMVVFMIFTILISTIELGVEVYKKLLEAPRYFIGIDSLLDVLGQFLIVLIGIELLETMKSYLQKNTFRLEIVIMVSIIAVVRKIIIFDLKNDDNLRMIGIAFLVLSLSVSYYMIKKTKNQIEHKDDSISNS